MSKETSFSFAHPNLWIFKLLNCKCWGGTASRENGNVELFKQGELARMQSSIFNTSTSASFREKYLSATMSVLLFSSERTSPALPGAQTMKAAISLVSCHHRAAQTRSRAPPITMLGRVWKLRSSKNGAWSGHRNNRTQAPPLTADCKASFKTS